MTFSANSMMHSSTQIAGIISTPLEAVLVSKKGDSKRNAIEGVNKRTTDVNKRTVFARSERGKLEMPSEEDNNKRQKCKRNTDAHKWNIYARSERGELEMPSKQDNNKRQKCKRNTDANKWNICARSKRGELKMPSEEDNNKRQKHAGAKKNSAERATCCRPVRFVWKTHSATTLALSLCPNVATSFASHVSKSGCFTSVLVTK